MKRVLILGAGFMAKPLVDYLLDHNIRVLIASPMKDRAEEMTAGNMLGAAIDWSMDDPETLDIMIGEHDIIVSLLPFIYQSEVASKCVKHRRPLVTTSYIQPGMAALNDEAHRSGVLLLNEMGLDPGIDHMTAGKIIDHVHGKGGIIEEFYSICGAIPAPETIDNPLGYKFTWSPKRVILDTISSARYMKKGREIYVEPEHLFKDRFGYFFQEAGDLEVYPDKDSMSYIDIYGIPNVRTIYKGTFRHKGWCETLDAMLDLKLLDDTVKDYTGISYAEFMAERAGCSVIDIKKNVAEYLKVDENSIPLQSFEFLGLFSNELLDYKQTTPFHITSDRMIRRMSLQNNERDMVIIQNILLASYPGSKREVIKSSMIAYGTPASGTAISRTVALPAAIAARLILENKINLTGVCRPVEPGIYNPVLDELRSMGIEINERFGLPESEMI